ncbi:MAG: site-specific integrase [Flavipsychrobacter sp.]
MVSRYQSRYHYFLSEVSLFKRPEHAELNLATMDTKKLFTSFFLYKQRINKKGECPILLRITIDKKRENVSTGIHSSEKNWDPNRGRIKGNSKEVESQNQLLSALETKALDIYTELLKKDKPISSAIIKSHLQGNNDKKVTLLEATKNTVKYITKRIGIDLSEATLTKYKTLETKIAEFIKAEYKRNDILLSELSHSFIVKFELYLKTTERIQHNTTIKYIQFLKRIINYSVAQEWIANNPFNSYRCKFNAVHREVLTTTELEVLESKNFETDRLRYVRDIFIFCCYTGLAYADVYKLTMDEIVLGVDNKPWIQTFRQKTRTRVPIPLLPKALNIIQEYHEWRKEAHTDKVLPVSSNQKMNAYLKEIGEVSGIKKKLTFHMARHTFATTITLNNGVPIETVSKLLGHTNIKTTQIYAKVTDVKIATDMSRLLGD